MVQEVGGKKKVVGKCVQCRKSAVKKDAECRVAMAEMAGQDDFIDDRVIEGAAQVLDEPTDQWCCMHRVLTLQDDFANEKHNIQHYLDSCEHVCLFYPKFHCEINPIEMLWGYMKYHMYTFSVTVPILIASIPIKDFELCPMGNLQHQRFSYLSVWIWQTLSQSSNFFRRLGGIWTLTGEIHIFLIVKYHPNIHSGQERT